MKLSRKIQCLKQKYNKINEEDFIKILVIDKTKTKKYIHWMLKRFLSKYEDRSKVIDILNELIPKYEKLHFNKRLKPSDNNIQSFKTTEQLFDALKFYNNSISKSQISKGVKDFDKDINKDELQFENEFVIIVSPKSKETSCKYGVGTKWCTSARGHSNYFDSYYYNNNITLYYILPKNKKEQKIAVAVDVNGKKEFFNTNDSKLSLIEFEKQIKKWDIPF